MSSPIIWIILPLVVSVILWLFRRNRQLVMTASVASTLALAALAVFLPIGEAIKIGSLTIEISPEMVVLGRRFVIDSGDRYFIILIYLIAAFWFFGSGVIDIHNVFVPIGMAIIALLVAALAVDPFLYSALLVEIAVLISIPMLSPPGSGFKKGVLSFVIFQTLALPFMLFAGWALSGIEANPSDERLIAMASALLGLGFAFWLAVFPFNTWMPQLAEQAHPYVTGFLLIFLPTTAFLLTLKYLDGIAWLRDTTQIYNILIFIGALMVVTGGVWSLFQKNLGRLFSYGVIIESGFSMIALGIGGAPGLKAFSMLFLPRIWGLGVWSLAMTILAQDNGLDYSHLRGVLYRKPIATIALFLGILSIGGVPLLAGFPTRQYVMENLAGLFPTAGLVVVIGIGCFLAGGIRLGMELVTRSEHSMVEKEDRFQVILLAIGCGVLLAIGLMPEWFINWANILLEGFTNLQ
ncbi:MAG: proton-conducting transporter membrane subunit [Anaerolineaceae bacterium]